VLLSLNECLSSETVGLDKRSAVPPYGPPQRRDFQEA